MAEEIGRRLRLSNEEIEQVIALVRHHLRFKDVFQMRPATLKRFARMNRFEEHLELHRLDCLASHGDLSGWQYVRNFLAKTPTEELRLRRLVTGDDLIALGYSPGPRFAEILNAVEDAQLEGRLANREDAISFVLNTYPLPP
jgi:poly(A) polymerase